MKKMKILFFFCSLCIVASIRIVAQEVKTDEATGEQIYILKRTNIYFERWIYAYSYRCFGTGKSRI